MSVEPLPIKEATSAPATPVGNPSTARDHGPGALGARPRSALVGSLARIAVPLLAVGSVATLALLASARWDGWVGGADAQVTDNATIRADVTRLAARVAGTVARVAVADYQQVQAGDLLMELDPAEFQAAVAQADAAVAGARAALANLTNQMALQQAAIAQADAQVQSIRAGEKRTGLEASRQQDLLRMGLVGTRQKLEQASADHDKASADARAADAFAQAQRRQLDVLRGQEQQRLADLAAAEAALTAAKLRLSYTRVLAPFDGVVGERSVQTGDYVGIGAALIAVVPLPSVHVTANYKETQLTRVVPGQPVEVRVDMFPGTVLRGHVVQMAPASGATFALLPPDNATGNFTKVVQRIPVRIDFDAGQPLVDRLRPGMSVETRIQVGKSS